MNASTWTTIAGLATALGTLSRRDPEGGWFASVSRHWNIDRPDPR